MNVVVQIFAREPRPGECKRRMIPALGPERAAQLHKRMLEAALRAGQQSAAYQVELWGAGSLPHPELRQFARRYGISLFEQEGDDLGARMLAAMRHASDRGLASVLMGSDCPELSEDRLDPVIDVVSAG
ncbi:MAG: DUF2064 domain-containing protein, partial [Chromatiales bacterium]|nr:DUF2064 domain-containing protein [Chromatiales bacterium]